eukprot:gene6960-1974_t
MTKAHQSASPPPPTPAAPQHSANSANNAARPTARRD